MKSKETKYEANAIDKYEQAYARVIDGYFIKKERAEVIEGLVSDVNDAFSNIPAYLKERFEGNLVKLINRIKS